MAVTGKKEPVVYFQDPISFGEVGQACLHPFVFKSTKRAWGGVVSRGDHPLMLGTSLELTVLTGMSWQDRSYVKQSLSFHFFLQSQNSTAPKGLPLNAQPYVHNQLPRNPVTDYSRAGQSMRVSVYIFAKSL